MSEQVLKISTGYIKGLIKTTALNSKKYYSFRGIPFAEPPIGKNRFKDPIPCKPWEGVRDATKVGNICPQFHEFFKQIIGDDDCLFLNVFTPKVPEENNSSPLLPVMVYIHGGGFTFGSGNDDIYGPDYLVEHNVILVTFNYRVGVFGFLSLGNSDVPGNAGLKDQCLALRWVQENIKYFGGNSNNVTLFGESAGAASAHFQTLSPLSAGLFHKVILQSGDAFCPWAYCDNPVSRALRLGEVLGNKTENVNELVEFLRNQSSADLVKKQEKILTNFERKKLAFPFLPCKEVSGTGMNFMTEDPITLSESGKFAKVPFIIGMTDKEGMIMLKEDTDLEKKMSKIDNDSLRFVPIDFCKGNKPNENVYKKVKKFYFDDAPLSTQRLSEFIDVCSDMDFTIAIQKLLKHLSFANDVPVYVYLFSFDGQLGVLKRFIQTFNENLPKGVCHADDLGYIFHNTMVFKELPVEKDSPEVRIIDTFCTFWTNFAKNSDPNDKKFGVKWKQYSRNHCSYLDIGETLKSVDTTLFPMRTEFWENVFISVKLEDCLGKEE